MLLRALNTYVRAIVDIGVPVMTLAPLNDGLIPFYAERGFVPYGAHRGERRMMLTAEQAVKAFVEGTGRP